MSIPPVGWEQNVQHAAASASPSQSSSHHSDPGTRAGLAAYADSTDQTLCHVQDPPAQQTSPGSELSTSRGFLTIARHGSGPSAIYVVTYRRIDHMNLTPKPVLAEGAGMLIELLEKLGVNLRLTEVRGALEDVHRLGSANIPDLWLSEEQMTEKGLVED
jgi:hypothetical protein